MSQITRLAILERGEPAVRVLAAVGDENRSSEGPPITTVLAHTEPRPRPWFAREADEVLVLRAGDAGSSLGHDQAASPAYGAADVVASLTAAQIDAVWVGFVPCHDQGELVAACEAAGITVVGPDSATVRRLADPAQLAALVSEAGMALAPDGLDLAPLRGLEVDIIADSSGTVWALDLRAVSLVRGAELVIAETPAPEVPAVTAAAIQAAARALAAGAGYRGAGVVRFVLHPSSLQFWCTGVDTLARPEHALIEETTGASYLGLRLRLALGGRLDPEPPTVDGHAVAARLLARDPDRAFASSGGSIELLTLPAGTGVRVDASIREGDIVVADVDPLIATVTAWGHDRDEALARLRRALERTAAVLEIGATNRSGLLALLSSHEVAAGRVTLGWYDDALASGALRPAADPVAVLAAAVEAYEADLAMVRASFFASAERGRPEHPEAVGSNMSLSYRGAEYRLRVDRTAPGSYRIHGGVSVDVSVDRLGEFERRISCGGRRHAIVAVEQGADFRIEVDGVAHTVTRGDGVVVRTGWPALVSQVLVEPGQNLTAGQPVAVLESMKMVSTVTAPFDGMVTSVAVIANAQVERGAPLLRIRATTAHHLAAAEGADGTGGAPAVPVDFAPFAVTDDSPSGKGTSWVFQRLVDYLLGYDLDPARLRALVAEHKLLSTSLAPDDPA
ncbi:MAG TPA: biotin/lipoyl-containing protein, partial [Candidatus Lustribacter sp.]|nr:biotin/lipoyl-containing protein [Candidatus Lustribacter sp.]